MCRFSARDSCVSFKASRSSSRAISAIILSALAWERARASGDIFAWSSLKFLAIDRSFLLQCGQVLIVELVRNGNGFFVPPVIAGFVTANQQDGTSPRV